MWARPELRAAARTDVYGLKKKLCPKMMVQTAQM